MNLIEMNKIILSNKKKVVSIPILTQEDVILFKQTLLISKGVSDMFEKTDDSNSFFTVYPDVKKIVGARKCVECFYAVKLGYYVADVPTKLLYILNKLFKDNDILYPNTALNKATKYLMPYIKSTFKVSDGTVDVHGVINSVANRHVTLLTDTCLTSTMPGADTEVFIRNCNRVAILPKSMAEMLSPSDIESLSFNVEKGIVLGDIPIRTLGNRIGLTKDDFDLRMCV